NVRIVGDHAAGDIVVRRGDYLAARGAGVEADALVPWLAERGKRTVYTPDASVSAAPPPLVGPHLAAPLRQRSWARRSSSPAAACVPRGSSCSLPTPPRSRSAGFTPRRDSGHSPSV